MKIKRIYINRWCLIIVIGLSTVCNAVFSQTYRDTVGNSKIRLNQFGFYSDAPKVAIVITNTGGKFALVDSTGKMFFTSKLVKSFSPAFSGEYTYIANFSTFKIPGSYFIEIPGLGRSYSFKISNSVLKDVADGSIKAFYYMRASIPLQEKYAGKWNRAEGHPDNKVLVHGSAASDQRLAGTIISSPRGWYDAGDYNKYVVNSGISTSTLLSLYDDFPAYMNMVNLNIPESGNKIPDVLNEVLWNLRWMLTMQDPNDGGVYHKLTNAAFDKMEMPDQSKAPRYVVQKSTAATLDFAAVMAQASMVFKKYNSSLPGLSDSCLKAAENAWNWAVKNPHVIYDQDAMNKKFSPPITTGGYGDAKVNDEFIWAASELLICTYQEKYITTVNLVPDDNMPLPSWGQVRLLGYYDLVKNSDALNGTSFKALPELKKRLFKFADEMVAGANKTAYQTVMNKSTKNFAWGSNSNAANQGIALIQAYKLSGDKKYLHAALGNLDYLLGRNGTGYSYITGFGSKTPMHPHHRPSVADGIVEPIPGLLVGGPNPGMQDRIKVPSTVPDEAYIDDDRAYAANEIAINWNAPFAYLVNAIQALQSQLKN